MRPAKLDVKAIEYMEYERQIFYQELSHILALKNRRSISKAERWDHAIECIERAFKPMGYK